MAAQRRSLRQDGEESTRIRRLRSSRLAAITCLGNTPIKRQLTRSSDPIRSSVGWLITLLTNEDGSARRHAKSARV